MKLKYYLRGMGIGIILTAIVMGFALGGRKATLSDAEIIQRAKALGMVDGDSGVLLDSQDQEGEEKTDDTSASSTPLFEEGAKIPEKEQQEIASSGSSNAEVAQKEEEGKGEASETSKSESSAFGSSTKETETASASGSGDVTEASAKSTTSETGKTASASAEASKSSTADSSTSSSTEASTEEQAKVSTEAEIKTTASGTGINTSSKTVSIPGGLGSDQVAQILVREGIIDNAVSFNKYLVDSKKDRVIRSGVKTIPAGATYEQIASIITK